MDATKLKSGSRLERLLARGEFVLTGELGPPRSVELEVIDKKVAYLKGYVDAANVTDNQTAIVRISSIAVSKMLLDRGLEPVAQITCRDRNRIAIQSDVLGAYALGLRNILCLTGDHQTFGDHPTARHVFDLDSIQLLRVLKNMRDEKRFASGEEIRNGKKGPLVAPEIFLGAAANPFADPFEFRIIRLAKKVKAGADFIQTQIVYDMERFEEWLKRARDVGLTQKTKILAGITPLKSVPMAKYMKNKVAGVSIPDALIDRLAKAEKASDEGIKIAVEQIQHLRQLDGIAGIHLMAIEWEHRVPEIVEKAGLLPRPTVED
jgi:methylenetetrahydrofolate reductase (NADPH)